MVALLVSAGNKWIKANGPAKFAITVFAIKVIRAIS